MDEDLVAKIDAAKGDVSRSMWIQRAVERALGIPIPGSDHEKMAEAFRTTNDAILADLQTRQLASSAKAGITPRPKKGKR